MFELSVACKYLIPRWRQLSVSIISFVSTLVIALVVWLIVVFFSVKDGLEESWVNKIVALTAPIRVTPTEKYYQSHYYLIDKISANANYTAKSIGEKLKSHDTDPYDPEQDEEIPLQWPSPDINAAHSLKDLVKEAFAAASHLPNLKNLEIHEFETTTAHLQLKLQRPSNTSSNAQQSIEQPVYLGTFDTPTPMLSTMLLKPSSADLQNILSMQTSRMNYPHDNKLRELTNSKAAEMQPQLQSFFEHITIKTLKTPANGWRLPLDLLPEVTSLSALAIFKQDKILKIMVSSTLENLTLLSRQLELHKMTFEKINVEINKNVITYKKDSFNNVLADSQASPIPPWVPIILEAGVVLPVTLINDSLSQTTHLADLQFSVDAKIQNVPLKGVVPLRTLEIDDAVILSEESSSFMAQALPGHQGIALPPTSLSGDAILLPRSFKEAGALIGDQGFISYYSPTPSSVQEQRLPVYVVGFYDPGIMPIGSKYLLADKSLIGSIRGAYSPEESLIGNGINIRFSNLEEAMEAKTHLLKAFEERGISPYWHVETYQEYDFTKDLLQQLHSEKNLFSLISLIIIIVACSNIISMLIILVNDKKLEIGILRSMGASSASIATIFGICGMVMGTIGSLIGITTALITLKYVNELVGFIGTLQGHDLFNPVFYGHVLPTEVSYEALSFVVLTTAAISLLAGIIPAIKACTLRPSTILRAE